MIKKFIQTYLPESPQDEKILDGLFTIMKKENLPENVKNSALGYIIEIGQKEKCESRIVSMMYELYVSSDDKILRCSILHNLGYYFGKFALEKAVSILNNEDDNDLKIAAIKCVYASMDTKAISNLDRFIGDKGYSEFYQKTVEEEALKARDDFSREMEYQKSAQSSSTSV